MRGFTEKPTHRLLLDCVFSKGKHSVAHLSYSYSVPGSKKRGERSDLESE